MIPPRLEEDGIHCQRSTLTTLQGLKQKGEKIVMLTCYDATFAKTACDAGVEMLLIGDSLGMVLQGHDSTLPVTVADMAYHTASVKRGNRGAMIVADLPFMANATTEQTLNNSALLMQAGAHMIKLEGSAWLAESIRLLAERGIPVCAHMGLTPQAVNLFGGYKVQGREEARRSRCWPTHALCKPLAPPCSCSNVCPANWPRASPRRSTFR
ncbi:3-methyl-2-oxobutanoate hydroxymethyltransferase [Stutzerimonas stutzeri]